MLAAYTDLTGNVLMPVTGAVRIGAWNTPDAPF
jgi:hypothetical protein